MGHLGGPFFLRDICKFNEADTDRSPFSEQRNARNGERFL